MLNAIRKSTASTVSTPGVPIVGHTRASSAMLSVPVAPYSRPSAVRKMDEAIRLMVTYLNAASICARVRLSAINTNDATSITSNQT